MMTKTLSTLSLAFALVGGAIVLAPSQAEAANNKGHISFDALKKNNNNKNNRPGQPANKWSRGCSAITRCRG